MNQCSCVTTTLEIFIRSLSGLRLSSTSRQNINTSCQYTTRAPARLQYARSRQYSTAVEQHHDTVSTLSPSAALGSDVIATNRSGDGPLLRSRTENRLARKVRRMEAGTWQPKGQASILSGETVERAKDELVQNVKGLRQKLKQVARKNARKALPESGCDDAAQKRESRRPSSTTKSHKTIDDSQEQQEAASIRNNERSTRERTKNTLAMDSEEKMIQSILDDAQEGPRPKLKAPRTKEDRKVAEEPTFVKPDKPAWAIQKAALKEKFGDAQWAPRKRISPDSLNGIRALHASDPLTYSTPVLAQHFKITPEAVRRILKSKWQPKEDEIETRRKRWETRGRVNRAEINAQKQRSRNAKTIRGIMNPKYEPGLPINHGRGPRSMVTSRGSADRASLSASRNGRGRDRPGARPRMSS